jgi:hypothetical protein
VAQPAAKAGTRAMGLAPVFISLDLLSAAPSYEAKETDKTDVWALASVLPLLSICTIRLAGPR